MMWICASYGASLQQQRHCHQEAQVPNMDSSEECEEETLRLCLSWGNGSGASKSKALF